ncbi:NAD-dependent epimerase/dehydratase family protein (plasmid) [Novosphingobium resinovorum]|uniref:NAD-dependent epimerase/dehydratase family protein n=1 Tax=Novosphingobium TaxID=165696 RepID=UPI001B3C820C|nr:MULTISPECIES: NAD-dependent epimerase/dehydratase family protein [Novosphingobium]MBF7015321.1 NAD-dependent epimerase/dehydratase family protein [Novosphingobium sp. HR1a]WJM30000.1 NAD-dependent epimerase/dehydratase family protein [Novosphingobium resinovorum]
MRVIVTGAAGFVGSALVRRLQGACDVLATDVRLGGMAGVEGDLTDPSLLAHLFAESCDAVVHLASVPGGAAEQDPELAKRVNIDATMALVNAAACSGTIPRFVFASSIAVFGTALPRIVDDRTPVAPTMVYGAHKAMAEEWIATMTRRGAISGLALRVPGVVARAPGSSGLKSAFMSDLFSGLMARQQSVVPVTRGATVWVMSALRLADNLAHALQVDAVGSITLPALRVSIAELVAAICDHAGAEQDLVRYAPDPEMEAAFGQLPLLKTPCAKRLGFSHDGNVSRLVHAAFAGLRTNFENHDGGKSQ